MQFRRRFLLAVVVFALVVPSQSQAAGATDSVVVFQNVTVISMTSESPLEDQTVVVRGDRIGEVGRRGGVPLPEGALTVDGSGKYLLPGLAEMHGHIPPLHQSTEYLENVLFLYLANGVTTVRGMLGAPNQLELREKAARGEVLSPTLYLAGPSFSGGSIQSAQQAIEKARRQKNEGWDFLKVHPGLTMEQYEALARTARELSMPLVGHVPSDVGLLRVLELGQETVDHLDGYIEFLGAGDAPVDPEKLQQAISLTKRYNVAVVPTMVLWETLLGVPNLEILRTYPELRYMPSSLVKTWVESYQRRLGDPQLDRAKSRQTAANRRRLLKAMSDGGVRILFGTDAPQLFSVPGFSIHREMRLMRAVGLTPYQIIKSGTADAGRYFRHKDEFGTIEVGKRADLILLEANPLVDLENMARLAGVMVRGRWLTEAEIRDRLETIARSYGPD